MRQPNYNGNPIGRGEAIFDHIVNDTFREQYGIPSEAEQTREFILALFDSGNWAFGRDRREYYGEETAVSITLDQRRKLVEYRRQLVESQGNSGTDKVECWQEIIERIG